MTQEKPPGTHQPDDGDDKLFQTDIPEEIPLLQEAVDAGGADVDSDFSGDSEHLATDDDAIYTLSLQQAIPNDDHQHIATLEAIVFEGETADAPSSNSSTDETSAAVGDSRREFAVGQVPPITLTPVDPAASTPLQKGENPFLPKHILDRLYQGRRNLVEEIAQSGAALDASAAILRSRARSERSPRFGEPGASSNEGQGHYAGNHKQQKIIDELVEEYLPLLAAELRRRLKKVLDE